VEDVVEIEPLRFPEPEKETDNDAAEPEEEENLDPDAGKSQQDVLDELTGQLNLFD
jgi:topoisomerase-4 subunit A